MTTTIKVHIQETCKFCNGSAYLPYGEVEDWNGEKYIRHQPCAYCQGTGLLPKWISLRDLIDLIDEVDPMEPDYKALSQVEPISQYQDSRESAGI